MRNAHHSVPCWTTLWFICGRDSPTHIFRTIIAESRPDPGCLEVPYRALGSAMAVVQDIVIRLDG
jgi:hypothetical protein